MTFPILLRIITKAQLSKIFKTPNAVIGKLPEAKYTHNHTHTRINAFQLHRKNKQNEMNFFSKKFPSVEIFHFWAIENCYRDGAENEKSKNGAVS